MRLIDADALENTMTKRFKSLEAKNGPYDHYTNGFDDAISYVEDAPTIDAVPVVHARWSESFIGGYDGLHAVYYRTCSNCSSEELDLYYGYCPNCGAKMDEGAEA